MKLFALAGLASTLFLVASPDRLAPARFNQGRGWHVGASRVRACPGVSRSRCSQVASWAATVRWRDCWDCDPPHRTLDSLPQDGIAISLNLGQESLRARHRMAWPPHIRGTSGPIEGDPSGRISVFQSFGRLDGFDGYLSVFFGRPHPDKRQIARAQAELDSARLP